MRAKLLLFFLAAGVSAYAAISSVSGSLDPQQIRIGEQVKLHYEIQQEAGDIVSVPFFADSIVRGVELVQEPLFDTIDLKDGRIQVNLDYVVTSFDSGFYYIPAMPFACEGDTVQARALGLSVNTVEVNPDTDDVKDIKPIMDPPFSWQEFFTWTGIVIGILAVLAIIALLLMKFVFKKKVPFITNEPEPQLPPHVEALQRLERVRDEKMWQNGHIKEFYTEITDIIREYMDRRFGINAMELTSDQIIALAKKNPELDEVRQILKQMLEISDLVKFAKFVPLEAENSRSMLDAFAFVEKTSPQEPEPEETEGNGQEPADKAEKPSDKEEQQ